MTPRGSRSLLLLAGLAVGCPYCIRRAAPPLPIVASRRASPARVSHVSAIAEPDDDDGQQRQLAAAAALDEEARAVAAAVGGQSASVQFMMTAAMRAQLAALGYTEAEIDGLEPSRAAAIIQQATPSSKVPQRKPKSKRDRFELRFTCNVCGGANSHSISRHAYTQGTVIVQCPSCNSTHLIADNLNWIEDDFQNLEEFMAKRGTPVERVVTDGVAAAAATRAATQLAEEEAEEREAAGEEGAAAASPPAVKPLDGISDDQAARIREAVRANKQRRRQDQQARQAGEEEGE